jgi:hypothetical protein
MVPALIEVCQAVPEWRGRQGMRYPLPGVLALVCLALLSGCNQVREIARWGEERRWVLSRRLGFKPGRMPSEASLRRVLAGVDVAVLAQQMQVWVEAVMGSFGYEVRQVAIDGKRLRGSATGGHEHAVLNALAHPLGVALGQVTIPEGGSEQGMIATLLEGLVLENRVVSVDALHTQRQTATGVREKKAIT